MPINPTAIRSLRKRLGLTQQEAADAAGIARGRWSDLERGARVRPSLDLMQRVADALGVQVQQLVATAPKGPLRQGK